MQRGIAIRAFGPFFVAAALRQERMESEGDEGDCFNWISKDDDDGARRGADIRLDDGGCYDQMAAAMTS